MWEKIKKSLDEAYQGVRTGTSKVTLKTEEKTRLTRLSFRINSLKKDVDAVMMKLGNGVFSFREEQREGNIFQDPTISEILNEADQAKTKVDALRQEMDQLREDFELRIKGLTVSESVEQETQKTAGVGKE